MNGGAIGTGWDSIVHASFQLSGAFSEKVLTAEGVKAVNAIPVLHVSVGAKQTDVPVDKSGDGSLSSFYREQIDKITSSNKRPLSQTLAPGIKISHGRATLRASKQQRLEDFFSTGFGG